MQGWVGLGGRRVSASGLSCETLLVRSLLVMAMVFIALPTTPAAETEGRVGVLYVGCLARSAPFWWMRSDPLFRMSFVQATLRDWAGFASAPAMRAGKETDVYRFIRLYMPRTYRDLTSSFDVVVLANANTLALGDRYIEMIARGTEEGGTGLTMFGGWESFGGAFGRPSWGGNSVGKLLPVECVENTYIMKPKYRLFMKIDKPDHQFMGSLPWDRRQPFMTNFHHNLVKIKPGAQMLAHIESPSFSRHPAMVTDEVESGARTFAVTGEIIGPSSEPGQSHSMCTRTDPWEYALDFGANLMIYMDKRPVPQDVELAHRLRQSMFDVMNRKSLVLSLIEFCDSFGANTLDLVEQLDEVEDLAQSALPVYLDLKFEEALEIYERVHQGLDRVEENAVELKNRALLWVYIIEWLVVSGTSMIAGVFLWSVMVRRRLYHTVRSTHMLQGAIED